MLGFGKRRSKLTVVEHPTYLETTLGEEKLYLQAYSWEDAILYRSAPTVEALQALIQEEKGKLETLGFPAENPLEHKQLEALDGPAGVQKALDKIALNHP